MNYVLPAIQYFMIWGLAYGGLIGTLTGASAWKTGAQIGAMYGVIFGLIFGFVIGSLTAVIHRLTFHEDINLVRYRRHLAALNGCLTAIVVFCLLIWFVTLFLRRPPRGYNLNDFYPILIVFISQATVLTALCVAYISSHYPDWMVRKFYTPDPPRPVSYPVREAFRSLWMHFFEPIPLIIGVGFTMMFCLNEGIPFQHKFLTLWHVIAIFGISLLIFGGVTFFLSLGNAMLVTFLRRLLVEDGYISSYTYRYKIGVIVLSGLLTVLMTAWYWSLSPFYVYIFRLFFPTGESDHLLGKALPLLLGPIMAWCVSMTLMETEKQKIKHEDMAYDIADA